MHELRGRGNGDARQAQLLETKQVLFTFGHDQAAVFAAVDLRRVEYPKLLAEELLVAVPEKILRSLRVDAAGGVAVAVGLEIRVDQIPAVVADAQCGQHLGRDLAFLKIVLDVGGELVGKADQFVAQVLDRILDLAAEIVAVRVVSGGLGQADAAQPGEMEGKPLGTAAEATEVAVEVTLLVDEDHQGRSFFSAFCRAERAGGLKDVVFQFGLW